VEISWRFEQGQNHSSLPEVSKPDFSFAEKKNLNRNFKQKKTFSGKIKGLIIFSPKLPHCPQKTQVRV